MDRSISWFISKQVGKVLGRLSDFEMHFVSINGGNCFCHSIVLDDISEVRYNDSGDKNDNK